MITFKSLIQNLTEGEKRTARLSKAVAKVSGNALKQMTANNREAAAILRSAQLGKTDMSDAETKIANIGRKQKIIHRATTLKLTGKPGQDSLGAAQERARQKFKRRVGNLSNYALKRAESLAVGGKREESILATLQKRHDKAKRLHSQLETAMTSGNIEELKRVMPLLKQAINRVKATSKFYSGQYSR